MSTLYVYICFIKAILFGLLRIGSKQWRIAGTELFSKRTFRLADSSYRDYFIGFRVLKSILLSVLKAKRRKIKNAPILIIESSTKFEKSDIDYICWQKNYNPNDIVFLAKENAVHYSPKFPSLFFLALLSIIVLPFTMLSKYRVQWALILVEYIEILAAYKFVVHGKIKKIHWFSVSEKDSNLAYLILKGESREIIKHPSSGALTAHNKNIMSDVLALSSNYQVDEYNLKLRKSVFINEIEMWDPEGALQYHHLYAEKKLDSVFEYKYGFYSHGGWHRKENHKTQGLFSSLESEEKCLDILHDFFKKNSHEKIIIFLHPNEKQNLQKTRLYYYKWFDPQQIKFYTEDKPSSNVFLMAEVGIGAYSTILFERDYYNFKTLVYRDVPKDFPVLGSRMYESSFNNVDDFTMIIKGYNKN